MHSKGQTKVFKKIPAMTLSLSLYFTFQSCKSLKNVSHLYMFKLKQMGIFCSYINLPLTRIKQHFNLF